MTSEQYFVILGTIYLAPHISPVYCKVAGLIFLLVAIGKQFGLI
jgi:hypothetical protein